MEFLKYSNIDLSEIIKEGLIHNVSKLVSRTDTKEIEKAFAKLPREIIAIIGFNIKNAIERNPKEDFKSSIIPIRRPKSIEFGDYYILPKLNNRKDVEEVIVYSLSKEYIDRSKSSSMKYEIKEHVVYSYYQFKNNGLPPVKVKDRELAKQVHLEFTASVPDNIKMNIFGKTYTIDVYLEESYDQFDSYEQLNHFIHNELEDELGRELTDKEADKIYDDGAMILYKIALKCAKNAENSKAGKIIGAKYKIDKPKKGETLINIEYNF